MAEHFFFLCAAYLAAVVGTVAGFGSSTILIPVAIFFMDVKAAVFLVACFHLFGNLFKIRMFFKKIDFRLCRLFGIPSIFFAFLGARLITVIPVEVLTKVVAVFLIFFSILSAIQPRLYIANTSFSAVLGGGFSGFLAGLIGMGGAIRSVFLISFKLPKEIYVATAAGIAFVIDLTRIPTYMWTKAVGENVYYGLLPALIVVAYAGVRTGKLLLGKVSQDIFRKTVLGMLFLMGLKLFF